jgi:hypothetical protein
LSASAIETGGDAAPWLNTPMVVAEFDDTQDAETMAHWLRDQVKAA